jgi:hypothetical protein
MPAFLQYTDSLVNRQFYRALGAPKDQGFFALDARQISSIKNQTFYVDCFRGLDNATPAIDDHILTRHITGSRGA